MTPHNRQNILLSTTRGWNPGDDWIRMGILRLLGNANSRFQTNPILFNRHPNIWGKGADNSYKIDHVNYKDEEGGERRRHSIQNIDYFISAGTPEWDSKGLHPLYRDLLEANVRCSFIGIGQGTPPSEPLTQLLADHTDVVICRDDNALGNVQPVFPGAEVLPCPAFLLPVTQWIRQQAKRLGLVYMSDRTGANRITPKSKPGLIHLFQRMLKAWPESMVICHYVDEALEAREHFPGAEIFYSYDPAHYEWAYAQVDVTVGHRLHGAILGAGTGAPAVLLLDQGKENGRRQAGAKPFGFYCLEDSNPASIMQCVENLQIQSESQRLVRFQGEVVAHYQRLLQPMVEVIDPRPAPAPPPPPDAPPSLGIDPLAI